MSDGAVRPAATLMLVRDGADGDGPLEVLMLRRSLASVFMAGAYVFPGGALDAADAEMAELCEGRTDASASAVLGTDAGGLAYWVAAVRECFEEAGLLLAVDAGGELVSMADEAAAARFNAHRHALVRGERTLADICRTESLRLATDRLYYCSHWITPAPSPRRFDTRFFVAPAPTEQVPLHDEGETIANEWMRPADALARFTFIRPTKFSLEAIAPYATVAELLAAFEAAEPTAAAAGPRP